MPKAKATTAVTKLPSGVSAKVKVPAKSEIKRRAAQVSDSRTALHVNAPGIDVNALAQQVAALMSAAQTGSGQTSPVGTAYDGPVGKVESNVKTPTADLSNMQTNMNQLSDQLDTLCGVVGELKSRLRPILSQEPEGDTAVSASSIQWSGNSDIAVFLRERTHQIESLTTFVRNTIRSLEI